MTVPAWFQDALSEVGASCAFSRWGKRNYVIPVAGMPYWRTVRTPEGRIVMPGTPGSYVVYNYDGRHHEHGNREWRPPARFITEGRLMIVQPVPGPRKWERVLDLVEETGEPVEPALPLLQLLAMRKDAWDRVDEQEAARQHRQDQAEDQAGEERLAAGPGAVRGAVTSEDVSLGEALMGEAVERLVVAESAGDTWVYMNDPKRPTEPGFRVIDRRRFAAEAPTGG